MRRATTLLALTLLMACSSTDEVEVLTTVADSSTDEGGLDLEAPADLPAEGYVCLTAGLECYEGPCAQGDVDACSATMRPCIEASTGVCTGMAECPDLWVDACEFWAP